MRPNDGRDSCTGQGWSRMEFYQNWINKTIPDADLCAQANSKFPQSFSSLSTYFDYLPSMKKMGLLIYNKLNPLFYQGIRDLIRWISPQSSIVSKFTAISLRWLLDGIVQYLTAWFPFYSSSLPPWQKNRCIFGRHFPFLEYDVTNCYHSNLKLTLSSGILGP